MGKSEKQFAKYAVIMPAHNEGRVIRRSLEVLSTERAQVIVVANGCRDNTAEVARTFPNVRVLETEVGSKTNALNLGEAELDDIFPRFFVDADILIHQKAFEILCETLREPDVLAVMPTPRFDLSNSSWLVRAHHRVWTRLPFFRSGMIGSGVFGVNAEGRKRFGAFPRVIADDAFFKLHFKPGERVVVPGCEAIVRAPGTVWDLVKIKTRSHLGNVELREKFPELFVNEKPESGPGLLHLVRDPRRWFDVLIYVLIKLATRIRVRRQLKARRFDHWERDESSRRPMHVTQGGR